MIDFIQHFRNKMMGLYPTFYKFGYQIVKEKSRLESGKSKINAYVFELSNTKILIDISISVTRYEDQTYLMSLIMYNMNEKEPQFTWRSFHLFDYIDDNQLQEKFIYKVQGDEKAEAFINQYFKNLEFALNDYLKPYLTGEKYIDHYVKTMNEYYSYPAVQQMQEDVIKEHLTKKGKLAVFRQKVIIFKQDVRNYLDKVKNFFYPRI